MKRAVLFLATGFEEMEAVGIVDVLRRGGIETTVVSITRKRYVTGAHGLTIAVDALLSKTDFLTVDALILPGGMPGSRNLNDCESLKQLLITHNKRGKLIAAICAAPLVLGGIGLLLGYKATCYPGFESQLIGADITGEAVVVDRNMITGKGPGWVFDFALAIVKALKGKAVAEEVANGLLLQN
ncbi:MAG: DJ-1/PfpI family protein [Tannerellaceae bacterium]|jgi:4-methyl-5(b-hydroxyethyl)-thiazole monophosphate biosynthesis|nr:DJ-1/PfpI family protein [Tannerellaceae bacterium]